MAGRILIFANKAWETDALVAVIRNAHAVPSNFPPFDPPPQVAVQLNNGGTKQVSARLAVRTANATAELWCVQDLMDPARSSSSSEEKARVIPAAAQCGESAGAACLVRLCGVERCQRDDTCGLCLGRSASHEGHA